MIIISIITSDNKTTQQDCNFFALSVINNSSSVNLIVIKTAIICHNHKKVKFPLLLCHVSHSLLIANETEQRNSE
jgi:hypothetical protein